MNQYLLQKAKVQFSRPLISDLTGTLEQELTAELFPNKGKVAIAVGSRGIHNIAEIVKTTVTHLKTFGISPFIVPAMGSHARIDTPPRVQAFLRPNNVHLLSVQAQLLSYRSAHR